MSPRLLTRERSQVGGKRWEVESPAPTAPCVTVAGSGIARRPCGARAPGRPQITDAPVCLQRRIVDRERQFCLSLVLTEYRQLLEIDSASARRRLAKSGGRNV